MSGSEQDRIAAAGELAQTKIRSRVENAMRVIKAEIDDSYDSASARHSYSMNHGRISISEVLRRAGGVDKNTLKQPYHAALSEDVRTFVRREGARLSAHLASDARRERASRAAREAELTRYAQLAYAAELQAASLAHEVQDLQRQLAARGHELKLVQAELIRMKSSEPNSNVVQFSRS